MSSDQDFKSKFNTGAEVLQKLLEEKAGPVSDQYLRWKLWLSWKEIVGPTVAENAEPISYHQGTLWLWVRNSVWMQQMSFMSEPIKNSVNQKFRKDFVREVRFTLDRKMTPSADDENFKKNLKKFIK
jgi:predicted nucleic acid-binding Zn ribbon protein